MDSTSEKAMKRELTTSDGRCSERDGSKEETYRIEEKLQYNVMDQPPFLLMISLALQNILTIVTFVMGFSAILSDVLCIEIGDPVRARIFSTILAMSGFGTIVQTNFGVSSWPVTGLTGYFVRFISPVTIAVTIATIGFSVIDFTLEYCQRFWGTSMLTASLSFIFIFYLNNTEIRLPPFTKKARRSRIFRNYPILLAVCIGWTLSYVLTIYGYFSEDPQSKEFLARTDARNEMIDSTPWFTIPYPGQYGYPKFHIPTFFGFTIAVITSIIKAVGDYLAAGNICDTGRPPQHAVNRGIMSEGFTGILSGFMGAGNGTTSYSTHIALIGVTKVASRIVLTVAGFILIVLAMLGKVAAVLAAIPDPVIGGSFLVFVSMMVSLGLSTMQKVRLNTRNTLIFGTAVGFGQLLPRWIERTPNAIDTGNFDVDQCLEVVLGTPIFVASVLAGFLDNTVPVHSKANADYNPSSYAPRKNHNYDVLYEGHIKLTPFQRILLTAGSAAMCLYDPVRDDMVSTFGETTGHAALKKVQERMMQDPEGQQILKEKPIVSSETIDLEYLDSLPDGTLGKEYWRFLSYNGFDPDGRRPVNFVDDPDLMYIMLRYRQIHDLLHSLMGMPPHMLGEVVIKWVEALQTGLPMCYTAAIFGPLRFGPKHSQLYWSTYMPWAIRCGRQSKFLMSVYFEKHWERNVSDLRKELNIEDPPKPLLMKDKRKEKDESITE